MKICKDGQAWILTPETDNDKKTLLAMSNVNTLSVAVYGQDPSGVPLHLTLAATQGEVIQPIREDA